MTEIAYHPTHVRALRETFKALRTAEFPWTAETIYLNNASIGPIPERTRRALDEFTAKRTAPHLLPDRELFAGLAAARLGIAHLINAAPSEIALATNTGYGLHLAARALPLEAGDVVLLSDKEFPANVYPWLLLRDQGITVEMARCTPQGWPDEEHLLERLRDPKVRVLAVSFVQFSNGYRADLKNWAPPAAPTARTWWWTAFRASAIRCSTCKRRRSISWRAAGRNGCCRRGDRDSCTCVRSWSRNSSRRSPAGWHSRARTISRGSPSIIPRSAPMPAALK